MIRLNTEKGIVRISSWNEIEERPGFQRRIDPSKTKLKAIIGSYRFKEKVHCGLPCNQPHLRGYLVETETGAETNIGKDCGKTHFSVNFEEMRINFDRDMTRKERQETIARFKTRLPDSRRELQALKDGGANALYKLSRPLVELNRGVPSRIVSTLNNMIRTGSGEVYMEREATEQEYDEIEARSGRSPSKPQFVRIQIGAVAGIGFFATDLDLRRLIAEDIEPMFKQIEELDELNARDRDLGAIAKWIGAVEGKFEPIRKAIALGRILLTRNNLANLSRLLQEKEERRTFASYIDQIPA
ncbi:MAG: hypothetical protein ACT4QA_14080 [Panacagrimonas sp.]